MYMYGVGAMYIHGHDNILFIDTLPVPILHYHNNSTIVCVGAPHAQYTIKGNKKGEFEFYLYLQ